MPSKWAPRGPVPAQITALLASSQSLQALIHAPGSPFPHFFFYQLLLTFLSRTLLDTHPLTLSRWPYLLSTEKQRLSGRKPLQVPAHSPLSVPATTYLSAPDCTTSLCCYRTRYLICHSALTFHLFSNPIPICYDFFPSSLSLFLWIPLLLPSLFIRAKLLKSSTLAVSRISLLQTSDTRLLPHGGAGPAITKVIQAI